MKCALWQITQLSQKYQKLLVVMARVYHTCVKYYKALTSVGWYQFFTSGIQYYIFRVVFGVSWYLNKQNCTRKTVELALLITV